jgi:hypothetical protein
MEGDRMKRFLWLGIFFLSASWLFFIPQFTIPDFVVGTAFIFLGILCMIAGVSPSQPIQLDKNYLILFIALVPVMVIIPFPYNLGPLVLALGLFSCILLWKRKTIQAIPLGIMLSGLVLLVQTMVFPFYKSFVSHGHRIDVLSPVVSFVANLLGLHTSTNNGLLFIQTIQQTSPMTITWENLGCYLSLNMFLAAVLLFMLLSTKRTILTNTVLFLFTATIYVLLRFVGMLSLYLTTADLSIFWNPFFMTLGFLPFALLLMKLLPLKDVNNQTIQIPQLRLTKKHLIALLMMFLLVFSFTGAILYQDPGSMKNGRVLIDEYHSEWEDTLRPLDTEWYGLLSTYNYYSWAQWLSNYYTVEKNTDRALTRDLLNNYDILILKCPTESYTMQEIESIKQFVENGGGLYLIGDHTNVFGMNTFLNQVSEELGIRFKNDATYELGTGNLTSYIPDRFFSHPVMRHVTQFDFMTSCTLEPTSLFAQIRLENIMIGNRVISEPGTYATENFFRESIASPDSEYGYFLQAAAIKYGKGRVVAFTDSTVFSSFCIFTDGYPPFTLGVMEYLNRTNSYPYLPILFLCVAILSSIVLVVLLQKSKKIQILWMVLFSGLLAVSLVTPLCYNLNGIAYPLPVAKEDYVQISFEQEHSSSTISLKPTATLGTTKNNYGTFFVWTQRVGCIPSLEKTLKDATENGDIVVIINPTESFTESKIHLLTAYLEQGGRVLLMDSIMNTESSANELLGSFGMWLVIHTNDHPLYFDRNEDGNQTLIGNSTTPYLSLLGGRQILHDNENKTYASMIEVTNKTTGDVGTLVVIVDSYTFSDAIMGNPFTEPTERQRRIYDTEFFLITEVLKD